MVKKNNKISKVKKVNKWMILSAFLVLVIFGLISVLFFSDKGYCVDCNLDENLASYAIVRNLDTISVGEWRELYVDRDSDVVVLDVRTAGEFAERSVDGAVNLDFYGTSFRKDLGELDKSKTYLIYCRSGSRAGKTLKIMDELKFESVYNLGGGISVWK